MLEVGLCECEITFCSPRDKHNAINKKMDNLVYKRIAVNIVTFHLSVHVFQPKSKIELC